MQYKTPREEQELEQACPALQLVAKHFSLLSANLGVECFVTRILTPVEGESGVHLDYRAVDFRNEQGVGGPHLYTDEQVNEIVAAMNKKFPRQDGKLVCIHHAFTNNKDPKSARAPYHFHVQIPWQAKIHVPKEWV